MATIACIGWGSLIWDSRGLPVDGKWFEDGPLVRVEFVRQSSDRRITLVLESMAPPTRALWTILRSREIDDAKASLQTREGCGPTGVDAWSPGASEPHNVIALPEWARARGIEVCRVDGIAPEVRRS
jgi:hypothetical protein